MFSYYMLMEMVEYKRKDFQKQAEVGRMLQPKPGLKYQVFEMLSKFFLRIGEEFKAQAISACPDPVYRKLEEIKDLR